MTVWVNLWMPEHLVDAVDKALADRVFHPLCLVVDLPQLEADHLVEKGLHEPVPAHDVEGRAPPVVGELDVTAGLPVDQSSVAEATDHT